MILRYVQRRAPLSPDEDALTRMIEVGRELGAHSNRLGLASTEMGCRGRVQAGLVAAALDLPAATFCLECTGSDRAATEAMLALREGLVLAADGEWAAGVLLGEGAPPIATLLAAQSAVAEYPDPGGITDYAEAAYCEVIATATKGLKGDYLAVNPPSPRLGKVAAGQLGFAEAFTGPSGAAGPLVALFAALRRAGPGERVLLVSYGAGSAADALLFRKEGG